MTTAVPDRGLLIESSAEIAPPADPFDADLALGATGLLRQFNAAGVLTAADVHVAVRLSELGGEPNESVRLAIAMAVRGVRSGSVCVDLAELHEHASAPDQGLEWPDRAAWTAAVRASPLVGPGKPLRWEYGLLYLDRYRRQEEQVRRDLLARRAQAPPAVDTRTLAEGLLRLFPGPEAVQQRLAGSTAVTEWTIVLGGGPGTGKTTTVARVLALLLDQPGRTLRIALAAPTGKAAARLQAAVQSEARTFAGQDRHHLESITASTLHRLLGWVPGGGNRFRHHRDNRLPFDVVVVDETSMVSLTLMARLLEAVRPDARLILVGDPDQLASVEAGAVLADLVAGLTARAAASEPANPATAGDGPADRVAPATGAEVPSRPAVGVDPAHRVGTAPARAGSTASGVVLLRRTWRFGGAIAELAAAVRDGDAEAAVAVFGQSQDIELVDVGDPGVRDDVVTAAVAVRAPALLGQPAQALIELEQHRLLCAHRTGPRGVQEWSHLIENWLTDSHHDPREGEWYAGRPVLVMTNDYALGLFNGDTGVVVRDPIEGLRVAFTRDGHPVTFAPRRLADVQTVHAMTVHRSQGSQFRRVTFVLPEQDSPLSSRELLYTALTRAQRFVRLVGTEAELRAAIARPAARASGLRLRLSDG
jgi:exodeoxyribonuclease V alpha subunit